MDYLEIVDGIVEVALDRAPDDIVVLSTDEEVDEYVEKSTLPLELVCMGEGLDDQIYHFWRLVKAGLLAPEAYVIFTGATGTQGWPDLSRIYKGVKFGSIYFLVFNGSASPPVMPSQRGMFNEEKR